jgi:hypothetical protein
MTRRVSVNIASLPEREEQLKKTVASIIDQVDVVNICLNNYDHNPFRGVQKVNAILSDNRYTDAGKFLFAESFNGYYLTLDDDLEVGETYVKDMIEAIDNFGVVSHHGRTFPTFPIESYYKSKSYRYRCLDGVSYNEPCQIIGSGVCGFHTDTVRPPMDIFKTGCMADIYFSIYCHSLGLDTWVLAHEKGYIKYLDIPAEETIWGQKKDSCEVETEVMNNYFTKRWF